MDIEKAKINLHELQYELKLEQEENIKKHGYNPEQEIEAIDVVLNELDILEEYKKITELTKISCCTAQNCEALNNAIKEGLENQKLKVELDNKDKIINEIAEMLVKDHEWFYSEFDNYTKQDFIDYFTKKVEGK